MYTDINLAKIRNKNWYVLLNSAEKPITGSIYFHMKENDMIKNINFFNTSRGLGKIYKVCISIEGRKYLETRFDDYNVNVSSDYYKVNRDRRSRF